ncbi:MAG: ATP-binding cassette domain-containing protein [Thermomicrobium sp.]|nr:ATP-binding cassette domain-containing protein [Thermomicrobium sp.]
MIDVQRPSCQPLLSVRDLVVQYQGASGAVQAVRGVSFDLASDESLALIGESGCGKTTLGLALLGLLPKAARIMGGQILYRTRDGRVVDVVRLSDAELRRFRWQECAMVFQGALNAFNPVLKIWDQVVDTARAHGFRDRTRIREQCERLLRLVQLDPTRVLDSYSRTN